MAFDQRFEDEVLAKTLQDASYLQQASRILDAHHFSTPQHSFVWKTIKGVWDKYREQVTPVLMAAKIKSEYIDTEDQIAPLELAQRLFRKKPTAARATLDELEKFVRAVNAQLAMEAAAEALESGDVEKTYAALNRLVKADSRASDYSLIHWIEDFEERQREREHKRRNPDEFIKIPTGVKRFDSIMSGGAEVGELGLIIGTTGMGKSALLSNFAFNSVRNRFPTLYVALEMPARQIAMRQDSRWLEMEYRKFKSFDFSPSELREIENRRKKAQKMWKNLFKIVSMPVGACNINILKGILDDLWHNHKFRPTAIMMDSGDHMSAVGKYESYRLSQAAVYRDLKALAESDGYVVWSSTHAGREWAELVATAESASESYDKSRLADTVISINDPKKNTRSTKVELDDDEEDENDKMLGVISSTSKYRELFLAKYRDGEARVVVPMDADFSKMLIRELQ